MLKIGGGGTLSWFALSITNGLISFQCGSTACEYAGGVGIHLPGESSTVNLAALLVLSVIITLYSTPVLHQQPAAHMPQNFVLILMTFHDLLQDF